jgi:hypothetical protein
VWSWPLEYLLEYVVNALFPIGKCQAEGASEVGGIKPGIGWPRGWQRVVSGGNGANGFRAGLDCFAGFACFTNNVAGVVTPVGFTTGNQVVSAEREVLFTFSLALAHQVGCDIGE